MNDTVRVLLVEDNPGDARLVEFALSEIQNPSYEVAAVDRLSNAVEQLNHIRFDVVLLDLSLPDSHGFDTITRVRQEASSLPLVILTGLDDESVGLRAVQEGAQDYLVKGMFEPQTLSRVIRYAIERKNTEEALRTSELKLLQKNREILDFTDTVTHDLKKPLATMKTVCSLFCSGVLGQLGPEAKEAIGTGREAVDYMQELLEDLLACAKLDAGTQKLEKEHVPAADILERVLSRLKYQIEEKKILVGKHGFDVPLCVDSKGITKVFMNLVGNAVSYIGEGADRKVDIRCQRKDGYYEFSIADNGVGIPKEARADVFDKFKRGPNVAGTSGTGLGLAIVKGNIEAHGGKVWFESEEGRGTTFYFTLPQ